MADFPIFLPTKRKIKKILPHRWPFLFLDRGEIIDEEHARGWKKFSRWWLVFRGHFPGNPIVPGVILQETLGQTASLTLKNLPDCANLIGLFTGVKSVKYRGSVHPGDELFVEAEITQHSLRRGSVFGEFIASGTIVGQEKPCITMEAKFAAVPSESINSV